MIMAQLGDAGVIFLPLAYPLCLVGEITQRRKRLLGTQFIDLPMKLVGHKLAMATWALLRAMIMAIFLTGRADTAGRRAVMLMTSATT